MTTKTEESNKALVLKAFDTLFNKRDYEAAARFWSHFGNGTGRYASWSRYTMPMNSTRD